ncbi:uncharacterized protein CDAR_304811 [Caerostris darwini]|uniref:Uncharacterized protein n=1 Tax=Caerostris darwini TaxID=1538125 RepID=A0AAV4Q6K0_9ARAC|nr:uncharacterized protein CDAR_304811 [Caerostris darwini]
METYSDIAQKVLNVPELASYISHVVATTDAVNLITPSWQQDLENNITYQDFQNNSADKFRIPNPTRKGLFTIQRVKDFDKQIKVFMVAKCNTVVEYSKQKDEKTSFSIRIRDSEPLNMITKVMTNDVSKTHHVSDEFRFYMDTCNLLSCYKCKQSVQSFRKFGFKIPQTRQPCIVDTKIYDGKQILNRFGSQIQETFHEFIGIFEIHLNMRYFYTKPVNEVETHVVRIGGTVTHLLALQESKLNFKPIETLNLGDLGETFEVETQETFTPIVSNKEENLFSEETRSVSAEEEKNELKRLYEEIEEEEENFIEALPEFSKKRKLFVRKISNNENQVEESQFFI